MMARREKILSSRHLVIASLIFGLFVLFDLFLFGWLIWSSLSQRELEKVLLETREEVEPLAAALEARAAEHEGDIWVVMSVATETWTYIDDILDQRKLVRRIEIRNRDGQRVAGPYWRQDELPIEDGAPIVERGEGGDLELEVPRIEDGEVMEVPIGDIGSLVIGLSPAAVQERIGVLRKDLIRQAAVIGILTLALLSVAFAAVWKLFKRARQSEEQALEAERLAYVGTLASGLAHEIRNPLNSLNLNMQMLEEEARELGAGSSRLRLLSLTRSELGRLERLASDFLSYAKPQPLELRELQAVELLERVLGVLAGEIDKRDAVVKIEDKSRGATVRVDAHQIGQLLLNLTQNALAAAPSPVVRLGARRDGGDVVIEVSDNGPGIAEEERERIFDLFYSTRKGGTGLGLAIVRRIARAHGTEVEVASAPGGGAVMRLRLPAAADATLVPDEGGAAFATARTVAG